MTPINGEGSPRPSGRRDRFPGKPSSGSRRRPAAARFRVRPNSAARLARTAPAARRLHSSRAIVPTGSEPAMPVATERSSVSDPFAVGAGDRLCPRPALGRWGGRRLLRPRFLASGERSRDCSLSSKAEGFACQSTRPRDLVLRETRSEDAVRYAPGPPQTRRWARGCPRLLH